jgi:membrane-bound ClpP family serine protease
MRLLPLVAIILPAAILLLILLRIIHASRRSKLIVKTSPVIGATAIAETDLNPEGLILVENEVWRAISESAIKQSTRVRIIGTEGVLLRVEDMSADERRSR